MGGKSQVCEIPNAKWRLSRWRTPLLVQSFLLLAGVLWAGTDPQFSAAFQALIQSRNAWIELAASWQELFAFHGQFCAIMMIAWLATALLAFSYGLVAPFVFGHRTTTIQSLLSHVAIAALWCAFCFAHPQISWEGKRIRSALKREELEAIAVPLRRNWPMEDGAIEKVGPFMAYPFGRPSTLILLTPPLMGDNETVVSTIEKSEQGGLRFLLSGRDGGDWVEWHDDSQRPESFTDGLGEPRKMVASAPLGSGWYLVRYE